MPESFLPCAPWQELAGALLPTITELNAAAAARGIATGNGKLLCFVLPGGSPQAYEERAWLSGEVEIRADNWHDAYNALTWLNYPHAKAALNRKHYRTMLDRCASGCIGLPTHQPPPPGGGDGCSPPAAAPAATIGLARGGPSPGRRGPLRDALTQFDECGLVVACADMSLWEGIRAHRWREIFAERRAAVGQSLRFFLFGHASLDALRAPFVGLTAKALCLDVEPAWLAQPPEQQIAVVDAWLAARVEEADENFGRGFQPLPLLGIPGVTPANEAATYYDDTRQFRPKGRGPTLSTSPMQGA